jgi:sulfhydrogenase subunit beta (sulfur reductase)
MEGARITGIKEPDYPETPILLFGIRPCDTRAIITLDKLFTWDYIDPYYVNKRERATIISFACTQEFMPLASCFCTSVGGHPASTDGVDMLWTDIGDKYVVEALTDKGNNILELGGNVFADASKEDGQAAIDAKKRAEEGIIRKLETDGIAEALEATFDSDYWDEFSKRCLGCGVCTLLCPTCHCFDIYDIVANGKAWRERSWDSCQYPYYSVHASGHNPRPAKRNRQRNRIYHKFLYEDKNLGVLGCVGCGRCVSGCPVNIDIIEVCEGAKETAIKGDGGSE